MTLTHVFGFYYWEENRELGRVPTYQEIKKCVWSLYWTTVKEKVCNYVKECFRLGRILASVNSSFIVFIPKNDSANNFNHYRLISLCNFTYKAVATMVASRLSRVTERLIFPNQEAFVRERWIAENTVIVSTRSEIIKRRTGANAIEDVYGRRPMIE